MAAFGYERTLCHIVNYVRSYPEIGHSEGPGKESAFDPKQALPLRL